MDHWWQFQTLEERKRIFMGEQRETTSEPKVNCVPRLEAHWYVEDNAQHKRMPTLITAFTLWPLCFCFLPAQNRPRSERASCFEWCQWPVPFTKQVESQSCGGGWYGFVASNQPANVPIHVLPISVSSPLFFYSRHYIFLFTRLLTEINSDWPGMQQNVIDLELTRITHTKQVAYRPFRDTL